MSYFKFSAPQLNYEFYLDFSNEFFDITDFVKVFDIFKEPWQREIPNFGLLLKLMKACGPLDQYQLMETVLKKIIVDKLHRFAKVNDSVQELSKCFEYDKLTESNKNYIATHAWMLPIDRNRYSCCMEHLEASRDIIHHQI